MSLFNVEATLMTLLEPFKNKTRKDVSNQALGSLEADIIAALREALYDKDSGFTATTFYKKWSLCCHPDKKADQRAFTLKKDKKIISVLSYSTMEKIDKLFSQKKI